MGEMIRIAVVCIKDTFGITEFIVSHPTYFCKYIFSEKIKKTWKNLMKWHNLFVFSKKVR